MPGLRSMLKLKTVNLVFILTLSALCVSFSPVALADNEHTSPVDPPSGSLVLPATVDEDKTEKKCMTVCQRWGEECMIDNARGVRKCRRTCKEFGQECF